MTKDEALKLALEALETCGGYPEQEFDFIKVDSAITAIREALTEESLGTEQPPCKYPNCDYPCPDLPDCRDAEPPCKTGSQCTSKCEQCEQPAQQIVEEYDPDKRTISVYPSEWKAQQQEPVAYAVYHRMGGSKTLHWPEQHSEDGDHNEYRLVPLYTSPPTQQQEPVYFCDYGYEGWEKVDAAMAAENLACGMTVEVYYTSPPASKPWVGLTDDEVKHEWEIWRASIPRYVGFAKGIEAKLREKNA